MFQGQVRTREQEAMYRNIDARFWTDPKVKSLPTKARFLFLYLITNPHTHVSGIYYLPQSTIAEEMAWSRSEVKDGLDTLSGVHLALYDPPNSVIWVVNMMRYQGKGDKNARSAAFHVVEDLHNSFLLKDFLEKYQEVKEHLPTSFTIPERYPIQEKSVGATPEARGLRPETRDQKPEGCSEPCSAQNSEPPASPFLVFPCTKTKHGLRTWELSEAKVAEYASSFPGVDVRAECRKALQWCRDNPTKIKTYNGMASFLGRWLTKEQNRGHPAANGKPARRTAAEMAADL